MKKKHKELILGLHYALCLLALTAEPTGEKATAFYIAYYLIVLANMAASVVLINNHMQQYYDTEDTTT